MILIPPLIVPYAILTLILGARATRLPQKYWGVIPVAFTLHHLTYFVAMVWGFMRENGRVRKLGR